MCGISGVVDLQGRPIARDVVERMNAAIAHRGPDGDGFFSAPKGDVVFGHRRLSVIDLDTGAQPMSDTSGTLHIVYNGEIYNYRELRSDLERGGSTFATASDTETILAGHFARGDEYPAELRGMFAYALWDARDGSVRLVRDRFGKKPLFYAVSNDTLYFASEMKALLAVLEPPAIDRIALLQFLTVGYVPGTRTIYESIRRLAPGHILTIRRGALTTTRYWQLPFPDDRSDQSPEQEWVDRVGSELERAVRMRLIADVPLGAFLSGGLDSSTIVALCTKNVSHPFHTFSIRVRGGSPEDADAAIRVSRLLGTVHHEETVDCPGAPELERLLRQYDEPFGDSSLIPTAAVSAVARKHVTVVLSGDGGDELFAGYSAYHQQERLMRAASLPGVRTGARLLGHFLGETMPGGRTLAILAVDPEATFARISAHGWGDAWWRLAGGDKETRARAVGELFELWRFPAALAPHASAITRAQFIDATRTYLPGDILPKVDIASMMHSLEVRVPLLDHVLAEKLARLPRALRMRGRRGKLLLRKIASRRLPRDIIERKKRGFSVPLASWLGGPLRALVADYAVAARRNSLLDVDPRLFDGLDTPPRDEAAARRQFLILSLAVWGAQQRGA